MTHTTFHRFENEEMVILINDTYEAELSIFDGSKKLKMVNPEIFLPTDFSKMQKISPSRDEEIDFKIGCGSLCFVLLSQFDCSGSGQDGSQEQ